MTTFSRTSKLAMAKKSIFSIRKIQQVQDRQPPHPKSSWYNPIEKVRAKPIRRSSQVERSRKEPKGARYLPFLRPLERSEIPWPKRLLPPSSCYSARSSSGSASATGERWIVIEFHGDRIVGLEANLVGINECRTDLAPGGDHGG